MSVRRRKRRTLWLLGLTLLAAVALGFGLLRGRIGQAEVELTPLEWRVRRANAQARLVALRAEVLAERPEELVRQQLRLVTEQLGGLESEGARDAWDALELDLAKLDVQLAQKDRETVATIDSVLKQLRSIGSGAPPSP